MNMYPFGETRSARHPDHLLQTPDAFVRAPLPGMSGATAVVHAAPALGAKFVEYAAEFEPGGTLAPSPHQRFVYVLEGEIEILDTVLPVDGYAWLPPNAPSVPLARTEARAAVIEKPWVALDRYDCPAAFTGNAAAIEPTPLLGDPAVEVRGLIPSGFAFDLAVNLMTFQVGSTLPMVEIHVMEHGLLMLSGKGIYRLGSHWYPVAGGDFIWMGPYLPQWYGALGTEPTRYLIYKDWNRCP
jgi:(S)-ureidoglycine aminohydrolase